MISSLLASTSLTGPQAEPPTGNGSGHFDPGIFDPFDHSFGDPEPETAPEPEPAPSAPVELTIALDVQLSRGKHVVPATCVFANGTVDVKTGAILNPQERKLLLDGYADIGQLVEARKARAAARAAKLDKEFRTLCAAVDAAIASIYQGSPDLRWLDTGIDREALLTGMRKRIAAALPALAAQAVTS
jgi:hypothetical protein